jgi:phage gp36-like protein
MPTLPFSYSTVELVQGMLPRTIGSLTTVTSANIANYGGLAEAHINGVLAKAYTLPFTGDIPILTAISTNMTTYYVLRRLYTQQEPNESDWVENYKTLAMDMLAPIADGTTVLVDSAGTQLAQNSNSEAWSNTSGYIPTMFEGDPTAMVVDPNKLDDEDDRRDF